MLLVIFNSFTAGVSAEDIQSTWWLVIRLSPKVEPSKVLSLSDLNNYRSLSVDPCSYWGVHNSRLALLSSLTRPHVEKTAKGWNPFLRVDLTVLQRRPSLSVAILSKFF